MNVQPVTDYKCCRTTNCTHDKGKTPPKVNLTKPPKEPTYQDAFVRTIAPEKKNDGHKRIGVMFSSGGGTN